MSMKKTYYIARSEFGERRFYKIERLRDFLWVYFPHWLHKIRVYRKKPNGVLESGKYVNDKRVVIF